MERFRELFVLFFKKLGLSLLNVAAFFVGMFLWGLTLYPANLPYLLKLPQESESVIALIFALTFVCIVVVTVRTKWCYETDLFLGETGDKWWHLPWRIVTSWEFWMDVVVFALYVLVLNILALVPNGVLWWVFLVETIVLLIVSSAVFGVFDCLLYVLARRKANRQLRKQQERDG